MKKITALFIIAVLLVFSACSPDGGADEYIEYGYTDIPDFSYFTPTRLPQDKHLYVFGNAAEQDFSDEMLVTAQAVQGLAAKDEAIYYLNDGSVQYEYWLSVMSESYGVTYEEITFSGLLERYASDFPDGGYILYDSETNPESLNAACTAAGQTGCIPVDKKLQNAAKEAGLTQKYDMVSMTEAECFEQYKDGLNKSILVQQSPENPHFRDYGVTNGCFFFYQADPLDELRKAVHAWADTNAVVLGWGPGEEGSHIGIISRAGQFAVPSDYCDNTTVFCASDFMLGSYKQKNRQKRIKPSGSKHYVTFVRSDGDNAQTYYNYFAFSDKDMGAERGNFPMGWSITPSLFDMAPLVARHYYDTAKPGDFFVASVSGQGYMYPEQYRAEALADYTEKLDVYLKRSGLSIVQVFEDRNENRPYSRVYNAFSRAEALRGGIYVYGDRYAGGQGSVYWSENGKPFVAFRETLWDNDVSTSDVYAMAERINGYDRNPKDIRGYTIVNLHPWSKDYGDVKLLTSLLKSHVQVVSPEQLFDMVERNVPKVDVVLA